MAIITREFVREKWIPALRSGSYQQGTGCLRDGENYCCLGVAADLVNADEWDDINNLFFWRTRYLYLPTETGLSANLQEYLQEMNDVERATFEQVADELEVLSATEESWRRAQHNVSDWRMI